MAQHTAIDWEPLLEAAKAATTRAYVPYSGYRVGAAALVDGGRLVSGCNVENASFGVTLCAECTMVGELMMGGGGRLSAFVCVDARGEVIMPCGRCRQLLAEHAGEGFVMQTPAGVRTLEEILPLAFTKADMDALA